MYSPKEISVALNNAVVASLRPETGEIGGDRLASLRAYTQALVEVPLEHLDEGLLTAEELVAVLIGAALYVQLGRVYRGKGIPKADVAASLMEGDKDDT